MVQQKYPKWKNNSRIIGKAAEKYCYDHINCLVCNSSHWYECQTNEKSKDLICIQCNKKYQIKCKNITQKEHTNIVKNKIFKTLGAEYKTTLNSVKQNIDYIIILYDKITYNIIDILHIDSKFIIIKDDGFCDNIIPRKPLSEKARRKGWQGCYLLFTNFSCINCELNTTISI